MDRILDTRLWKHYLSTATVADGYKTAVKCLCHESGTRLNSRCIFQRRFPDYIILTYDFLNRMAVRDGWTISLFFCFLISRGRRASLDGFIDLTDENGINEEITTLTDLKCQHLILSKSVYKPINQNRRFVGFFFLLQKTALYFTIRLVFCDRWTFVIILLYFLPAVIVAHWWVCSYCFALYTSLPNGNTIDCCEVCHSTVWYMYHTASRREP